MSKPKTLKPTTTPEPPAMFVATTEELTPTVLSSDDWALLQKVGRFLFHIQAYAARARLHGYDDAEHELGKSLLEKASGRNRPLSHWVAEGTVAAEPLQFTAEQLRLLQEVDAFENRWFPRIRMILQREMPEENVERFLAAFFKDLSQQPLGPGVLDSVSTLLDRFEALKTSKEPGAKAAHALGVKRGLTEQKIAQMRGLIGDARTAIPSGPPSTPVGAEELRAAQEEQRAALRRLRRWYNECGTTFRDVFGQRILIRLGLATLKRSARDDEEPEGEEPEGEEPEADEAQDEAAGDETAKKDEPAKKDAPAKTPKKDEKAGKPGGK